MAIFAIGREVDGIARASRVERNAARDWFVFDDQNAHACPLNAFSQFKHAQS